MQKKNGKGLLYMVDNSNVFLLPLPISLPHHPLGSGFDIPVVATLDMLSFLDAGPVPGTVSSTLFSRKPAQRSASDSLADVGVSSEKYSALRDGVLGVRWNGDDGRRRLLVEVPGLASPACSRCSSVQFSRPAMICRIWNFLGSDRSRERKWRKWLVTTCLSYESAY